MSTTLEREVVLPAVEPVAPEEPPEIGVLRAARELLSDPTRWCQAQYARDAAGKSVQPDNLAARQYCAAGALEWAAGDINEQYVAARIRLSLALGNLGVAEANDSYGGYERIMRGLDKALEGF